MPKPLAPWQAFLASSAMAFRFTLETVLRYRRCLEERERIRLQALLARRAAGLREAADLNAARHSLKTNLLHSMAGANIAAAELQFGVRQGNGIQQAVQSTELRLRALQTEIGRQAERHEAERRRSEVLQALRDDQQREYQLTRKRREQAMLDELHLLRHRTKRS